MLHMPSAQRCSLLPLLGAARCAVCAWEGLAWPEAGFMCGEESRMAHASA